MEYYYDESDEEADIDYSRKPVPILLSIVLVVTYIIGGAFLFQMWEGWSFLDSSYFCFITLTTIGFGDLTPDQVKIMMIMMMMMLMVVVIVVMMMMMIMIMMVMMMMMMMVMVMVVMMMMMKMMIMIMMVMMM